MGGVVNFSTFCEWVYLERGVATNALSCGVTLPYFLSSERVNISQWLLPSHKMAKLLEALELPNISGEAMSQKESSLISEDQQ